jgi:hypothetical protein
MAGFLYFSPGVNPVTAKDFAALGVAYAFSSDSVAGGLCHNNTPTDLPGYIFADPNRLGDWQPKMDLDQQIWRKIPKSKCYVGYWEAAPPTPAELARPVQLPGYLVPIGDHDWLIPLTARFDDERKLLATELPCYVVMDDDGKWTNDAVLEAHRALWDLGAPFREDVHHRVIDNEAARDFSRQELFDAAVGYLQANYVVGAAELSLMKALTTEPAIHGAILAANDVFTFLEWGRQQKKSAAAGVNGT